MLLAGQKSPASKPALFLTNYPCFPVSDEKSQDKFVLPLLQNPSKNCVCRWHPRCLRQSSNEISVKRCMSKKGKCHEKKYSAFIGEGRSIREPKVRELPAGCSADRVSTRVRIDQTQGRSRLFS